MLIEHNTLKEMPLQSNSVKSVELKLPVNFVRTFLFHNEDSNDVCESYGARSNNNKRCSVEIEKSEKHSSETYLIIRLQFLDAAEKLFRGQLNCSISNIHKEKTSLLEESIKKEYKNGNDITEDSISDKPRKRGRPKGRQKLVLESDEAVLSHSSEINTEHLLEKKYHLRGVKLSSKIMKIEKSSLDHEEDFDMCNIDIENQCEPPEKGYESVSKYGNSDKIGYCEKKNFKTISSTLDENNIGLAESADSQEIINSPSQSSVDLGHKMVASLPSCKTSVKSMGFKKQLGSLMKRKKKAVQENTDRKVCVARSKHLMNDVLQKFTCVICNDKEMFFTSKKELKKHEREEHSSLTCLECANSKTYKHIASLRSHCIWSHGENSHIKKHMCHHCSSTFKYASSLREHIEEIHEGKLNFTCKSCPKTFYKYSQLHRHEKIHGDAKHKLLCETCGQGFWHESNRQRHIRLIHKKPSTEQFHCPYCGKGFTHKAGMVAHIKLIHLNIMNFRCTMCDIGFSRSRLLVEHMNKAHKKKEFKVPESRPSRFKYNRTPEDILRCWKCSDSFYYKAELVEHMHTVHTNSFPFSCPDCNQGFVQQNFLNQHRKIAHGINLSQTETDDIENQWIISDELTTNSDSNMKYESVETNENISHISAKNVRYVIQYDKNLIYTEDKSQITNVTYISDCNEIVREEKQVEDTDISSNIACDMTYLTSENVQEAYISNVEYEKMEEVETSVITNDPDEVAKDITLGKRLIFQVEHGDKTVSYVIQPSEYDNAQEVETEDNAETEQIL